MHSRTRRRLNLAKKAEAKARVVNMPETLLAYCAGVIDSDGTIGIERKTYAMRTLGNAVSPQFNELISVAQVTPEAVDLLKGLFGGSYTLQRRREGRPMHRWRVTHAQAYVCLAAILPYLRIKRVQAENCLALREIKEQALVARGGSDWGSGTTPMPRNLLAAMEFCYAAAKRLNAVGVENHPPTPLEAAE